MAAWPRSGVSVLPELDNGCAADVESPALSLTEERPAAAAAADAGEGECCWSLLEAAAVVAPGLEAEKPDPVVVDNLFSSDWN